MSAAGKSCGECSLCCKLPRIDELNKPLESWCRHIAAGRGCGIYETRPVSCRAFFCRWILDPVLGPEWKPSKCKMILIQEGPKQLLVHVDPAAPGAWRREPYLSQLRRMARNGLAADAVLLIQERGRVMALLPDRVVELGAIQPGAEIRLEKRPVPGGYAYDVSVMRAG
jgi:hypothetical protein